MLDNLLHENNTQGWILLTEVLSKNTTQLIVPLTHMLGRMAFLCSLSLPPICRHDLL